MARYDSYGSLDDRIIEDLDQGFVGFNQKLRPDQLRAGVLAESNNGRMDLNGQWQPRRGMELFSAPFNPSVFTVPFYLYESIPAVAGSGSSYSRTDQVITVNFDSAHGINDQTGINISGLVYTGEINPNGNFIATVTSTTQFTYTVTDLSVTPTGAMTVTGMKINDSASNFIEASCEYSDTNNASESYIVCVASNKTVLVRTADSGNTIVTLTYPTGETVPSGSNVIQIFNKVYIFRKGKIALKWSGDITDTAFTLTGNGDYTQPVRLGDGGNNTVISNGLVTVTSTAHGLSVGTSVVVTDSSNLTIGSVYIVSTVPGVNTFTFYAQVDDVSSHNNHFSKITSQGLGFSHMPAPEFGTYHQRRLIVPYQYDVSGTSGSAAVTDRKILDEVLFSDILDADTYDRVYGQFRFNAGSADYIVGLHSFSDDQLVVFNRNSIHTVRNSLDLESSVSQLITNEVGCIARNTIQQIGNSMIFLSDNGVYGMNFIDLYNLRGQDLPLSSPIEGIMQRITKEYVHNATSVYFDNRYYLAIPIDESPTNNALVIYNFINKQWESVDSIANTSWDFTHLVVGGADSQRGVYCINRNGGVHRYEARSDDTDNYVIQVGEEAVSTQVDSSVVTRMFVLNSIDRKKWNNFELHIESSSTNISDGNLEAITENIDDIIDLGTISDLNGEEIPIAEDVSLRGRFGNRRAYGLQFKLTATKGRPKFRSLKVAGTKTFRSLQKAE